MHVCDVICEQDGSTPIFSAALKGHTDIFQLLKEKGAKNSEDVELLCELFNMKGVS
jgi:ankyrin repeat protein